MWFIWMKECGTVLWWQVKQWYTRIWKTALSLACSTKEDVRGSSKAATQILHSGLLRMKKTSFSELQCIRNLYPSIYSLAQVINPLRAKGYEM